MFHPLPVLPFRPADLLSGLRLVLAPCLLALAWVSVPELFVAGLALAFATDAIDGFVARRFGGATERGARLDSAADLALWSVLPLCTWWLLPEFVTREATWVGVLLACLFVPLVFGWLRYRRLTSYHTLGAKCSAVLLAAALLALFAGCGAALFHAAVVVGVASQLEELAITALLPRWRADVPSVFHAWALRRQEQVG